MSRYPSSYSHDRPAVATLLNYVLLLVLIGVVVWKLWPAHTGPTAIDWEKQTVKVPPIDLAADEKANIELFKKASPSVVNITTVAYRRSTFNV